MKTHTIWKTITTSKGKPDLKDTQTLEPLDTLTLEKAINFIHEQGFEVTIKKL